MDRKPGQKERSERYNTVNKEIKAAYMSFQEKKYQLSQAVRRTPPETTSKDVMNLLEKAGQILQPGSRVLKALSDTSKLLTDMTTTIENQNLELRAKNDQLEGVKRTKNEHMDELQAKDTKIADQEKEIDRLTRELTTSRRLLEVVGVKSQKGPKRKSYGQSSADEPTEEKEWERRSKSWRSTGDLAVSLYVGK